MKEQVTIKLLSVVITSLTVFPPTGPWKRSKKESNKSCRNCHEVADLGQIWFITAELSQTEISPAASSNHCPKSIGVKFVPLSHQLILPQSSRQYNPFSK